MARVQFKDLPLEIQIKICGMMTAQTFVAFKKTCKTMRDTFGTYKFPVQAQLYNEEIREVIQLFESVESAQFQKELIDHAESLFASLPPAALLASCQQIATNNGYPSSLALHVLDRSETYRFKLACTECCNWKALDEFPSDMIGEKEAVGMRYPNGTRVDLITKSEIPDWLVCAQCYLKAAPDYRTIFIGWGKVEEASLCKKCGGISKYLNDHHMKIEPEWKWERIQTRLCATCFVDVKGDFEYIATWHKLQIAMKEMQNMAIQISDSSQACTKPAITESCKSLMRTQWFKRVTKIVDN